MPFRRPEGPVPPPRRRSAGTCAAEDPGRSQRTAEWTSTFIFLKVLNRVQDFFIKNLFEIIARDLK